MITKIKDLNRIPDLYQTSIRNQVPSVKLAMKYVTRHFSSR